MKKIICIFALLLLAFTQTESKKSHVLSDSVFICDTLWEQELVFITGVRYDSLTGEYHIVHPEPPMKPAQINCGWYKINH